MSLFFDDLPIVDTSPVHLPIQMANKNSQSLLGGELPTNRGCGYNPSDLHGISRINMD